MLVLVSVLLIYLVGWLSSLFYWYAPNVALLMAIVAANLAHGLICFRIDYYRRSERLLQDTSYPFLGCFTVTFSMPTPITGWWWTMVTRRSSSSFWR